VTTGRTSLDWLRGAALAVLVRPRLWPIALTELVALASPGWWRRWPPVPRPAPKWMAFRLETQYGSVDASPEPRDVVAWLEWCRSARGT
jgi:hypothetical protein